MSRRTIGLNLVKATISIAALTWVLVKIPFEQVWAAVRGANLVWLLVVFLMMVVSMVVRAGRWSALLRGLGARVPFGRLVELYFVGSFFNSFLPSGFGGDAVRAAEVARDVDPAVGVGAVIVDRMTGLLVLFAMALLALPFSAGDVPQRVLLSIGAVVLAGLVTGFVLLQGGLLRRAGPWLERVLPHKIANAVSPTGDGMVGKVNRAITGCGRRALAQAFGFSTLFGVMLIGWWALAGSALGIDVSIWAYAAFVPVLAFSMMVPSIGGLGVREGLSSILFASAGMPESDGVALSLVLFVLLRGTGVIGGLLYLLTSVRGLARGRADAA
jgi:glycosyltransferase 2 family protein